MRIYTATPMAVLDEADDDYNFFCRDMGLTCHGLQYNGVESKVVLLDFPRAKKHIDMVRTTLEEMGNPLFWRSLELDAVVLGTGAAPRHSTIADAIKESGIKAVLRCDCGTAYSQWQKPVIKSLYENYLGPRYYNGKGLFYACLYSLLKTVVFYFPRAYERQVIDYVSKFDMVLNETPEGTRLLKQLLCQYGKTDVAARVKYVPHPVAGAMEYNGTGRKKYRIVSVGRWDHYSKNAPMLIHALAEVLDKHSEYEAQLFGNGEHVLNKLCAELPMDIQNRINVRGKIPNSELRNEYIASQIMFMPSRSEGSSVAAEEALGCGCSIVGSGHIYCMRNFVSKNSGTLARRYTAKGMVEALECEIEAWKGGLRDPLAISSAWNREVSLDSVVHEILSVFPGGVAAKTSVAVEKDQCNC